MKLRDIIDRLLKLYFLRDEFYRNPVQLNDANILYNNAFGLFIDTVKNSPTIELELTIEHIDTLIKSSDKEITSYRDGLSVTTNRDSKKFFSDEIVRLNRTIDELSDYKIIIEEELSLRKHK